MYITEDNYAKVLGMKVLEGRWFSKEDDVANEKPVVINELLRKQLFDTENPIGKIIESEIFSRAKIIGVVTDTKHESEAEVPPLGMYLRMDTSNMRNNILMMIKVKPGADPAFESIVYKTLSGIMNNANIEIDHLTDLKDKRNKAMQVPLIIFFAIASFLIINVALGIFGVLWYNIQKRRGEIGLRRAVGASGHAISRQLVTEAVLIATLALILGSFFAVQFPLLKVGALPVKNYVTAIIFSLVFIYVLVIVCSLYPGKQAAAIYPADALHED
jgi:putative ABC transport system permease protein